MSLEGVNAIVTNYRDITTRKQVEEKIIISERKLRSTLDNMLEGAQIISSDWKYVYVNDAFAKQAKYTKEELLGHTVMEKFPGIENTDIYKIYKRCFEERVSIHLQNEFQFPDKSIGWFELTFQPVPEGIFILSLDITERMHAEQQKEFDRNNLHALINNTEDIMWSVDCNFNLITSNEAFDQLVTLLCGKPIAKGDNVFAAGFPEEQIKTYRDYYERAFLGETFTEIEYSGGADDFWSEISFYPINEKNKVIGTACFSRNITERIKAEVQLNRNFIENQDLALRMSAILNTLPANIALLDEEGIILDVNDSWKSFADDNGFVGNNYCIGDNYIDISKVSFGHEKADGKKVAKGIREVFNKKLKEFVFEYECHSPELQRWFRMVVSPLQGKEYSGAVVMHIDISELRNMEKERLESRIAEQKRVTQAMLQGQEKERNHIGRELHDNINQILAGTKLYLGIAGKKDEAVKELVRYPMALIDNSIEEIRLLCHNLVTPVKNIDLESLIRDLLVKLEEGDFAKTTFCYDIPKGFLSDEIKLNIYRIVQEQVNNIYKYSKAKNVSISLKLAGHTVEMIVTDDGKGFDLEKNHNGIGISNMINRVESFNGEITIESSPGNGCTISIHIPY